MKTFNQLINERKNTTEYKIEEAKLDFILNVNRAMKERNISRSKLAEKLNTSKSYITKILQGDNVNFTIETMVKISTALGGTFETKIFLDDLKLTVDKNTRYRNQEIEWKPLGCDETINQSVVNVIVKVTMNANTQWL